MSKRQRLLKVIAEFMRVWKELPAREAFDACYGDRWVTAKIIVKGPNVDDSYTFSRGPEEEKEVG